MTLFKLKITSNHNIWMTYYHHIVNLKYHMIECQLCFDCHRWRSGYKSNYRINNKPRNVGNLSQKPEVTTRISKHSGMLENLKHRTFVIFIKHIFDIKPLYWQEVLDRESGLYVWVWRHVYPLTVIAVNYM
jgi:hypothetical protein